MQSQFLIHTASHALNSSPFSVRSISYFFFFFFFHKITGRDLIACLHHSFPYSLRKGMSHAVRVNACNIELFHIISIKVAKCLLNFKSFFYKTTNTQTLFLLLKMKYMYYICMCVHAGASALFYSTAKTYVLVNVAIYWADRRQIVPLLLRYHLLVGCA